MNYEIVDIDALGRIGSIEANNKKTITPNLFPVVHPLKNIISISELKKFGVEGIFTNSYILYQNESARNEVIEKKIHRFLNFDGLIATDSGAFQQYKYNNNHKLDIIPFEIEEFQESINSDFPVILDVPVQLDDTYPIAKEKVSTTIQRAKDNIKHRGNNNCHWYGPIHGGNYLDLIKLSSIEMSKLDFDVYALGGLVKAFLDYRFDLTIRNLLVVKEIVPPHKPLHMFGLGLPQFFSLAVACGCDLMDSAAYILFAKENRYFTVSTGTRNLEELEEFPCCCPVCCKFTPKEMKTLEEKLRIKLLAKHNLHISFSELRTIRQAIREGNLWELVEQRIRNHPYLVQAVEEMKENINLFERHEKIYKPHGRLYASFESVNRPLIHRYMLRLKDNYRVPKESKYLIIIPELDVRGTNSSNIKEWLIQINNFGINRKDIHVAFFSDFYGIIPMELSTTYPMGHYESINTLLDKDPHILIDRLKIFLEKNFDNYEKCVILIPETFENQFQEVVAFTKKEVFHKLVLTLKLEYNFNIHTFSNIEDLLQFLKYN